MTNRTHLSNALALATAQMDAGETRQVGSFTLRADNFGHMLVSLRGEAVTSFEATCATGMNPRRDLDEVMTEMLIALGELRREDLEADARRRF